jgi:hypothetical protein
MAIRNEQNAQRLPHYAAVVRCVLVLLGCFAIWWGWVVFPDFWQQRSGERIAQRIIAGESFKPEILTGQLAALSNSEPTEFCRPAALQSAAIIKLHISETAGNGAIRRDEHLNMLGDAIRSSLSCAPADPFLWLVLFVVEGINHGYKPEYLNFLRMSYALGPYEGWILERRNPVAIAELERLPPDLATKAIDEFMRLLSDRFYRRAVDIFCGTTPARRDLILPKMVALPLDLREAFARSVYDCGLDVKVPGVESSPARRPWER